MTKPRESNDDDMTESVQISGTWMIRQVPVPLMTNAKLLATLQQKTLRQLVIDAVADYINRESAALGITTPLAQTQPSVYFLKSGKDAPPAKRPKRKKTDR